VFGANTNAFSSRFSGFYPPSHLPWNYHALSNKTRHLLYCCQHRKQPHSWSSFHGIKKRPQIPMHHSAANSHSCVNSWALSHQTYSNVQKCPSKTTYKYHFSNIHENWRSLPYGTPRVGSASMLTTKTGLKKLAREIPEAKWETKNIHNHPYQKASGSGQHSGLNIFSNYPITTLKPQKAQIKQMPWFALTNLIIVIPTKHLKTAPAIT